jgi:hypothetical protein
MTMRDCIQLNTCQFCLRIGTFKVPIGEVQLPFCPFKVNRWAFRVPQYNPGVTPYPFETDKPHLQLNESRFKVNCFQIPFHHRPVSIAHLSLFNFLMIS